MIYANKLKYCRDFLEIKQLDIAKILSISNARYCIYENETEIIPIKYLCKLCDYFDISLDYVFEFTDIKNYSNVNNIFDLKISGLRLKSFRKENNLTLTKLGEILNCSYGTIAGYELGRYPIATAFLYTICKKYGISADYLLGKIDSPKYYK